MVLAALTIGLLKSRVGFVDGLVDARDLLSRPGESGIPGETGRVRDEDAVSERSLPAGAPGNDLIGDSLRPGAVARSNAVVGPHARVAALRGEVGARQEGDGDPVEIAALGVVPSRRSVEVLEGVLAIEAEIGLLGVLQPSVIEGLELFMELGANEEQINFPMIYAIGRAGIAKYNLEDDSKDLTPLLDTILKHVPAAKVDISAPLRMQPFNLAYDNFLGRMAIGRIYDGTLRMGDTVFVRNNQGKSSKAKITKIFTFEGMQKVEENEAIAGDIVMVSGMPDVYIGDTVCALDTQELLPAIAVDEPTISLNFIVNDSPFGGREGKFVTSRQIRERLEKELEVNVGLKVDFSETDSFKVFGRGELHVSILLEMMRREGFELQVSQPQVIIKEVDGVKMEPFEEAIIDVRTELTGSIIDKLNRRRGMLTNLKEHENMTRLTFEIPTRGLLGYRNEFIIDTRGEGILSARFVGFKPYAGEIKRHTFGSMISMATGKALAYSLWNLQERGSLYIPANIDVYEGMILGNVTKGDDLDVNPTKNKQMTNVRNAGNDDAIDLIPPILLTIERGLEIMQGDEYLEITPKSVRLRKEHLNKAMRARHERLDEQY